MYKSKLRLLGVSALVGAGLLAAAPAEAAQLRLGNMDVQIDTTASFGVTYRVADRETKFLPEGSGGPADTRAIAASNFSGGAFGSTAQCAAAATDADKIGKACSKESAKITGDNIATSNDNYDGSLNTDDGRLNFDSGDLTGGVLKFTSDIEGGSGALRMFGRVTGYYDAVLSDDGSFARSKLSGEEGDDAQMQIRLLDAYVSYDFDVMDNPVMIRAGKQVINWGESTFFLGGNSVFNALDVQTLQKPGAEIKDGLLPIEALYASVALPYDLTVEAYVGGWSEFEFAAGGTPLSNVDAAFGGGGVTGKDLTYIGGAPDAGGNKFNCNTTDSSTRVAALITHLQTTASNIVHNAIATCDTDSPLHFTNDAAKANVEKHRDAMEIDNNVIKRGTDEDSSGDNVGVALRWYSEALNSTEFGLYYQKYQSRLPYVKIKGTGAHVGITAVGHTTNFVGRGFVSNGTMQGTPWGATYNNLGTWCGMGAAVALAGADYSLSIGNDASDKIKDPYGIFEGFQSYASTDTASAASFSTDTFASFMNINCALSNNGNNVTGNDNLSYASAANHALTGENYMDIQPNSELVLQYPDEIEAIGLSFNTTAYGWGIQGDFAFRRNQPLQIDTDSLTLATYSSACVFESLGGVGMLIYKDKLTTAVHCNKDAPGVFDYDGFVREEVYNWDIGTTATYSRSNPITAALGADLLVLLTEFAGEYVPDMAKYRLGDADAAHPTTGKVRETQPAGRLAGRCTSGSDLGLGGLVGLDDRPDNFCRPTSHATQGLVLVSLQYNNVFGSAWSLSPRFVYREGLMGIGASPGSAIEGNSVMGLSLNGSVQGGWNASARLHRLRRGRAVQPQR